MEKDNMLVSMKVLEVTKSISSDGVFLIILKEKDGTQKVPIMVNSDEALHVVTSMKARLGKRPTLPEAFRETLAVAGVQLESVIVYKVERGVYFSSLIVVKDGQMNKVDCNIAEALAVAIRCNSEILMPRQLVDMQCMHEQADGSVGLPISSVDVSVLKDALKSAIENEDYEMAAKLRDEIKHRE
jgi:bifunctional DNase/RNase